MAPTDTARRLSQLRRLAHWLRPTRRQLVVEIGVEVVTTALGLPLPAHLAAGFAAHLLGQIAGPGR